MDNMAAFAALGLPMLQSDQASIFMTAFEDLASYVNTKLVDGVASGMDLNDAIADVLEDEQYERDREHLGDLISFERVIRATSLERMLAVPKSVPTILHGDVQLALRLHHVLLKLFVRLVGMAEDRGVVDSIPLDGSEAPDLLDPTVPASLRSAVIASKVSEVCSFAVLSSDVSLSMADELCARWIHGIRCVVGMAVGLIAELGDPPKLDDDLLPARYILSSAEVREERDGTMAALRELERSGGAGYPASEDLDDDDGFAADLAALKARK
ncbi:MAG TPA: hypothetical protein VGM88_24700 [Kofleriaceae bacterium]